MGLRERAVSAAGWAAVQQWGGQASNVLVFIALARLLDPHAFGLVAYIGVFVGLGQILSIAGFTQAIVQREVLEPEHLDTAFWSNLAIAVVFTLPLVLAAGAISEFVGMPDLAPLLRWLPWGMVLGSGNAVQIAIMRRELRFKPISLRTLVANIGAGAIGVGMAFTGFGVWSLVGQQLSSGALGLIVLWSASSWRPRFRWSLRHLRDLISFGSSVVGQTMLLYATERIDRFAVGQFLGSGPLGFYVIGARAVAVVTEVLPYTVGSVFLPLFSRMQDDRLRVRRALRRGSELNALVTFPVYVTMAALAPLLVPLVFGPQWTESVCILQILVAFGLARAAQVLTVPAIMALGKPSWVLAINTFAAVAGALAIVLGLRLAGLEGVAAAVAFRGLVVLPLYAIAASRLLEAPVSEFLLPYLFPLAVSSVLGAAAAWLAPPLAEVVHPWIALAGGALLVAILYVLIVRTLSRRLYNEAVELIWSAAPRQLRRRTAHQEQ